MHNTIVMAGGGTGGHVFPMLAVADALARLAPNLKLIFVGTERGLETKLVPERGYQLELMPVLPIRGVGFKAGLRGIWRAEQLLPKGRRLIRRWRPQAVFSIGGYAAGPICVAARSLGVPLALMEPNSVIGLANWLLARLAQRAYIAFPESERHFARARTMRTGVPIRAGFTAQPYSLPTAELNLLVLGGSQGAEALNQALPEALQRLLQGGGPRLRVLHQAGPRHAEALQARYLKLGLAELVRVQAFIKDMPGAIAAADLVVSRSGASAVSELCAVGRPSLLIPFPYAAGDHQRWNAVSLERCGAALCVQQREASVQRLTQELEALLMDRPRLQRMARAARERGQPNAAGMIAQDLLKLAGLALEQQGPPPCTVNNSGATPGVQLQTLGV